MPAETMEVEFNPWIQPAYQMRALSPQDAWEMEQAMEGEVELTQRLCNLVQWVNLVNCPVNYLEAQ